MEQNFRFLDDAPEVAAPRLLGCLLEREIDGQVLTVRIVETEAYSESDAASHSFKGVTPRTSVMFGSSGHVYVYFTYGMHYCMNVVAGKAGKGAAVLIRAVEPINGLEIMRSNRAGKPDSELTNGPAKLCQALRINHLLNGHDLQAAPLRLHVCPPLAQDQIVQTTRIGISKAKDVPWRFYEKDNIYVSRQ